VDALMEMAKVKLSQLSQHGDLLDRYGASVRVLGQRDLLKPDVLEAIDRAVDLTKHNSQAILNICFPYTSRAEITTAIQHVVAEYIKPIPEPHRPFSELTIAQKILRERNSQHLRPSSPLDTDRSSVSSSTSMSEDDITATSSSTTLHADFAPSPRGSVGTLLDPETINSRTLTSHLYTGSNPPLDLLVRTSGVERLSDFMLWQCHENTEIVFLKCLWPEFDLWTFLPVLVEWQWRTKRRDGPISENEWEVQTIAAKNGVRKSASLRRRVKVA
jgi:ditrans,polycis-polyprenyl diphosphate synthase